MITEKKCFVSDLFSSCGNRTSFLKWENPDGRFAGEGRRAYFNLKAEDLRSAIKRFNAGVVHEIR